MWIVFAIISGLMYSIQGIATRHILKHHDDAWAFSFWFSAVGAVVSFPFSISEYKAPGFTPIWFLMIVVGMLIVAQNLLNFSAAGMLEASVLGAISKVRLIWVLLFSVLFLREPFTLGKIMGTSATVMAGGLVLWKFTHKGEKAGFTYAIAATILYAAVIVCYKVLFSAFSSSSLTFLIFLIPAIINLCVMPNSVSRIVSFARIYRWKMIVATVAGAFANLAMNYSLMMGEASRSLVVIEAFLVLTLVGEAMILRERSRFMVKIIAVGFAVLGAVLIRL